MHESPSIDPSEVEHFHALANTLWQPWIFFGRCIYSTYTRIRFPADAVGSIAAANGAPLMGFECWT